MNFIKNKVGHYLTLKLKPRKSFMPRVVLSAFTKLSTYSQISSIEKLYATDMILSESEVKSLRKDFESLFNTTGGGTFARGFYKRYFAPHLKMRRLQGVVITPG